MVMWRVDSSSSVGGVVAWRSDRGAVMTVVRQGCMIGLVATHVAAIARARWGQLRRDPSLVEEYEKWARTAGVVGVGERVQRGCFGGHRVVGGRMARGARRKVRAQSQEYVGSDFNSVTGRSSGNINNNINTSPQD